MYAELSSLVILALLLTKMQYKIELRSRNHNKVSRDEVIKAVAACIPPRHKVDLSDPDLFILIEIFKV